MAYRLLFKVTSDNYSEAYILADRVQSLMLLGQQK